MSKSSKGIILRLATVLTVVAWGVSAQANPVLIEVNSAGTKLVPTSPGNCVSGTNHPGCVRGQGRQPINFNLTSSRECSPVANWELQHVEIRTREDGEPGRLCHASDDPVHCDRVASDFNADRTTGRVTPRGTPNPNHIQIRNNNSAAYVVWYTVYANCGGSDPVIDTDPRIENDGSGNM
jgi:hypothetical protein